jgi:site-specific recombinase XerD
MAGRVNPDNELTELLGEWTRHLRARNLAPRTIDAYLDSGRAFTNWAASAGRSLDVTTLRQSDVEDYLNSMHDRGCKPTTVSRDYRHLRQFFRWAVLDETITVSPMEKMSPPKVPETSVPVVTDEQRAALLKVCEGTDFAARRDTALIRFMFATGVRLGEVAGMTLADVDMRADVATVLGKGRKHRGVAFGNKTHEALRRYLKTRRQHPKADDDALWLGRLGPLKPTGIQQIIERRSKQAGIDPALHPHQLRHTWAHEYMAHEGNESDLMMLAGWNSRTMLDRYGRSAASKRAQDNARKLALDDRY